MNELNINSVDYYNNLECFNNIPYYCIRQSPNFHFNKNAILIINCDSDLTLHPSIRSLYKNTNQDDFSLVVFDNSNSTKFNIDIYIKYGFKNIFYLNNTKWYMNENDDIGKRAIIDIVSKYQDKKASIIHSKTVDYMMKMLKINGVENLILADSDVLFKKNPLDIIDTNYYCIGEYEKIKNRIAPYLLYLNINKLNINFYDSNRMLGITSNDWKQYDTCGSFSEDLFKSNLPYKEINIYDYIEHLGGGSYLEVADDFNGMCGTNITKEEQPQKAYEIICNWLNKNSKWYL